MRSRIGLLLGTLSSGRRHKADKAAAIRPPLGGSYWIAPRLSTRPGPGRWPRNARPVDLEMRSSSGFRAPDLLLRPAARGLAGARASPSAAKRLPAASYAAARPIARSTHERSAGGGA